MIMRRINTVLIAMMLALISCKSTQVGQFAYNKNTPQSDYDYITPSDRNYSNQKGNMSQPEMRTPFNENNFSVESNVVSDKKVSKQKLIKDIKSKLGVTSLLGFKPSIKQIKNEYKAIKNSFKNKSRASTSFWEVIGYIFLVALIIIIFYLFLYLFWLFVNAAFPVVTLGGWMVGWTLLFLIILLGTWIKSW